MMRASRGLDCWFEPDPRCRSAVPLPFENSEWFDSHYPGDFIVEYMAQTRGWFYTLHVLATALFDRPSFRTCISHGIVLGDDGQKMSKSLNNYPDPMMVFDTYGADAMRWYLLSSTILRGGDLAVTETGIRESVRHVVLPIWNTYSFFTMYANAANHSARAARSPMTPRHTSSASACAVADVTTRWPRRSLAPVARSGVPRRADTGTCSVARTFGLALRLPRLLYGAHTMSRLPLPCFH